MRAMHPPAAGVIPGSASAPSQAPGLRGLPACALGAFALLVATVVVMLAHPAAQSALMSVVSIEAGLEQEERLAEYEDGMQVPEYEGGEESKAVEAALERPNSGKALIMLVDAELRNSTASLPLEACQSRRREKAGFTSSRTKLIYVHIPKAGGMSIQYGLQMWARRERLRYLKFDGPFGGSSDACPPNALTRGVLMGHRGFGYCKGVEQRGPHVHLVVFREPISRIVSYYDYSTTKYHSDKWDQFPKGKSLSEIIKRFNATVELEKGERILRYAGSQQARFMCGYRCMGPAAVGHPIPEEELLARALENLDLADVVGILERLGDVMPQLRLHLSWVPPGVHGFGRRNEHAKTRKSELDQEAEAILREWSATDLALYKKAEELSLSKAARARECLAAFRAARSQP